MWLEGLAKLKNPISSGIEPATFEIVAYCLNQLHYRVPRTDCIGLDLTRLK
jgi:hypothetical protein